MIKALLVDLDGTLVDSRAANIAAYKEAISILGIESDVNELNKCVGILPWDQMLSRVLPPSDAHRRLEVAQLKRKIYSDFFHMVRINKELLDFLKHAKSTSLLALVTSASRDSVVPLLTHLQLLDYFKITITSDDCEFRKPNPNPYVLAAKQLDVLPSECLVFEDSDIGIQAALAFGAKVQKVCW